MLLSGQSTKIVEILNMLEEITNNVQTDPLYCNKIHVQLNARGYYWCGPDLKFSRPENIIVMKLLAVAVNEAIQTKVNLSLVGNEEEEEKNLHSLLKVKEGKSLSYYFSSLNLILPNAHSPLHKAKSPLDMAVGLKEKAPQWLVKNIIQHQYDIRWNTLSGKPDDYTFYQFCEVQNSTDFLKYNPRLAHVKATLYKERTKKDEFLGDFSKADLCPNVFIKTLNGWQYWHATRDENFQPFHNDLYWINESIMKFINENADTQRDDQDSLKRALEKPTLYWAVLEDTDFQISEKLKLKEISRTQVYVGKANNGIRGRWTKDSDNHCDMMKKCLENVYAMTTYDPLRLEGIQLVDARLALAKVRRERARRWESGERSALFVMKTFGDDVEKAEITVQKAEIAVEKANEALQEAIGVIQTQNRFALLTFPQHNFPPDETQESIAPKHSEELEKCKDELAAAKATVEELKESPEPTKLEVEAQLRKAEKWHRMGKKHDINSRNIIPYKDYRITWKPTDMAYGMNFN